MDIKDEDLIVTYNDKPILKINKVLLLKQNCAENLAKIKELHQQKRDIYQKIILSEDADFLKKYAEQITDIEFQLQDAWKFPRDRNFHRFWETPKCRCPRMDNEDHYPHGYYFFSLDCPLHGQISFA